MISLLQHSGINRRKGIEKGRSPYPRISGSGLSETIIIALRPAIVKSYLSAPCHTLLVPCHSADNTILANDATTVAKSINNRFIYDNFCFCKDNCNDPISTSVWCRRYKKIRLPHGTLISRLLLVEYLFCLYWKVTYEKVFCLPFLLVLFRGCQIS